MNIVRAYDIDNEADTHYIVMEYVEGLDFQRIVDTNGPLGFERAAEYISQAAAGIQHAHDQGVVHRDIKPANCLVDATGTVKVLDMGLVKFSAEEQGLSATHKDSVVGTADYLAPEQAINSSRVDHRADIYGLGGTLYFLLTGHAPFPEGTLTERLLKHQKEEPKSIYEDRPDAPAILVDICRRMMIKNPENRIQTADAVHQELTKWLAGRSGNAGGERETGLGRLSALGQTAVGNRWQEMIKTKSGPLPKTDPSDSSGDTISASEGDTARIRRDDELSLAPIEEESKAAADGIKSDVLATDDEEHLDTQVLSQIEEELSMSSSTSGSLIDLLEGTPNVSTSRVVLKRSSHSSNSRWILLGGIGIGFLAIGIVILVLLKLF